MQFLRVLVLAGLAASPIGCGQKGPLVLPDAQHPHKRIVPKPLPTRPSPPAPETPAATTPSAPAAPATSAGPETATPPQ